MKHSKADEQSKHKTIKSKAKGSVNKTEKPQHKAGKSKPKLSTKETAKNANKTKSHNRTDKPAAKDVLEATSQLRLIPADELVKKEIPARRKHWGKRIMSNQVGMIYGPRGKGKTWLSLAIAIAMSSGAKFLGLGPVKPRRAIYLDGEMDAATFQDRLKMTASSLDTELSSDLRLFTPESFSGLLPAITTVEGQQEIDRLIGTDWDLLFIDNYSAWSPDGRETAESWTPFIRWMLQHKHAGRCVIVIHHSGKNGKQRGSSKHEDALDWSIELNPSERQSNDGSLRFSLIWKKARHLASDQASPITACMEKTEDGVLRWKHKEGLEDEPRYAEAKKLKEQGLNNAQIAKRIGIDRSTVGRWFKS